MLRQLTRIPRELLIMTVAMIIANTASAMYRPLMPLYLETLGANVSQVGLFFTLEVVLSIAFRILGGWISDHLGRLETIAIGGVLGMGAMLSFTLAPVWQLAVLGALFGAMGSSMVGPSFQAYTAEQADADSISSTFGLVKGLFVLCMVIGPLLGGFLVERIGYKSMLWIATAIFAGAVVMRLWMAQRSIARRPDFDLRAIAAELRPRDLAVELRGLLVLLIGGGVLMWLFISDGLVDAGRQSIMPFLPKYVTEVGGLSESAYSGLFALMSLVSAVAMWPGGIFADRFGARWSIATGLTLMGTIVIAAALIPNTAMLIIMFAVLGLAIGFIDPAFSGMISKSVPQGSLGITWGIFFTAQGVLAIPAPAIGGMLYDNVSPQSTLLLGAAIALVGVPVALWKLRERPWTTAAPTREAAPSGK